MATAHTHLHFPSIDSTHLYALREAEHLAEGAVVTADFQTAGKGRFDRAWISQPGDSLLLSFVLKPAIDPADAALITPILALAVAELLKDRGITALIRWPNDVVVGEKKIAGILAESSFVGNALSFVVASVGVNVNQTMETLAAIDRPATSIFAEAGAHRDPAELLTPLLAHFDALYATFLSRGFAPLVERWREKQALAGKQIRLRVGDEDHDGEVTTFNPDGSITLTDVHGKCRSFLAGEVTYVMEGAASSGV